MDSVLEKFTSPRGWVVVPRAPPRAVIGPPAFLLVSKTSCVIDPTHSLRGRISGVTRYLRIRTAVSFVLNARFTADESLIPTDALNAR